MATLGERKLEALIGERVGELARVLPSAAPAGAGAGGLQDERFQAYRAVRALLQRLAMGQPVVLMLDDVHWADDASLELIAHLLRRPPPAPVLVALAFRAGQVPNSLLAALDQAGRDGLVSEIVLGPLSEAEADALLGTPALPAVYRQSGGNPFYLEELARAPAPTAAEPDAAEHVGVPPAVAAALGQEIAGLQEPARRLGWGAAVAGEPFDLDLAAAAAGMDERAALAAIDQLLASNLAVPTDVPRRYRFRHPLVRRAVYDGAGEAWRLEAHARTAQALADRPGALAARASHVERSARVGDEAAAAVLEQAGHAAAARAPAIAARWFEAALRLLGAPVGDDAGSRRTPSRPGGAAASQPAPPTPPVRVPTSRAAAHAARPAGRRAGRHRAARARAGDAHPSARAGRAARPARAPDRSLRNVREPARTSRRGPRAPAQRARGAGRPGERGGRRAARGAGRRCALRQRLRGDAAVGDTRRRDREAAARTVGWRRSPLPCCASPSTTAATRRRPRPPAASAPR